MRRLATSAALNSAGLLSRSTHNRLSVKLASFRRRPFLHRFPRPGNRLLVPHPTPQRPPCRERSGRAIAARLGFGGLDQAVDALDQAVGDEGVEQGPVAPSSTNLQAASTTNSTTSPVIQINGNNPATITLGSTYADLGATIVSPAADVNLGIIVLIDNATSTNGTPTIDTTQAGTHTVTYSVTDRAGLTSSATRTVIVTAPANDNTATQTATSTATH